MDPRLARRRQVVRERSMRRRLHGLLLVIVVAAIVGGAAWVVQSPLLAVQTIGVSGAVHADVARRMDAAGLREGAPMVPLRTKAVEEALLEDPWVAEATVRKTYPGIVEVSVVERVALAAVQQRASWILLSGDGVYLESSSEAPDDLVRIVLDGVSATPGDAAGDERVVGSLAFVERLDPALRIGASVVETGGELWATVDGYKVRLGSPTDMQAKAAALQAVLADGVPEGSVINLLAPARPAVQREPSS